MEKIKYVYIASNSDTGGIYRYLLKDNRLSFCDKTEVARPMYMTVEQNRLYAVLRQPFSDNENSGVCSWKIEADGRLRNQSLIQSTEGTCGCHLCVAYDNIYAANYLSGNIVRLPKGDTIEQGETAHPHCIIPTPDGKYLAAAYLGLDKVVIFNPQLQVVSEALVPKGHGSRHLCFSPNGEFLYCVNELGSTVTVFAYAEGNLKSLGTYGQISEKDRQRNSAAAIRLDKDYLYISHRGLDKIEVFPLLSDGKLGESKLYDCGGKTPRDILKVDSLMISTNLDSDTVTVMDCENGIIGKMKQILPIRRPLAVLAASGS